MARDLEDMIHEVDPDFEVKRYKRKVYEFGDGENKRKFFERVVPGEAYSWVNG